jgi:hypothetical protein
MILPKILRDLATILQDLTEVHQDLAMILQDLTKIQKDLAMTLQDFTKFVARTHGKYRMKKLYVKYTILWI